MQAILSVRQNNPLFDWYWLYLSFLSTRIRIYVNEWTQNRKLIYTLYITQTNGHFLWSKLDFLAIVTRKWLFYNFKTPSSVPIPLDSTLVNILDTWSMPLCDIVATKISYHVGAKVYMLRGSFNNKQVMLCNIWSRNWF